MRVLEAEPGVAGDGTDGADAGADETVVDLTGDGAVVGFTVPVGAPAGWLAVYVDDTTGGPVGRSHPLAKLVAGTRRRPWSGTLRTGAQRWAATAAVTADGTVTVNLVEVVTLPSPAPAAAAGPAGRVTGAVSWEAALFETLTEGVFVLDASGTVVWSNAAAARMLGFDTADDAEGRGADDTVWEVIDADGAPVPPDGFVGMRALATGTPVGPELLGVRNVTGGDVVWLWTSARPCLLADGSPGVVSSFADVTAAEQARRELAAETDLRRRILDGLSETVYLFDPDGSLVFANTDRRDPRTGPGCGLDLVDAAGAPLPPDRTPHARLAAGGRVTGELFGVRHPDGAVRPVRVNAVPLDTAGLLVTVTDVAEVVAAAADAATARNQLRLALDHSPAAVSLWRRDTCGGFEHVYANPASAALHRTCRASGSDDLASPESVTALLTRAVTGDVTVQFAVPGDPAQQWQVTASADGDDLVIVAADVTAMARRQDELAWLAERHGHNGLLNLRGAARHVTDRVARPGSFAVLWVEMRELDSVRETFGFAAADAAAAVAAARVADRCGPDAVVAQPDHGSLVVLLPDVAAVGDAAAAAATVAAALGEPLVVDGAELLVGAHVGLVIGPLHGRDAELLLQRAKTAAAEAHRSGTAVHRWNLRAGEEQQQRIELIGRFERAVRAGELVVEYQPKVTVAGRDLVGVEALVRWDHPERGLLVPREFLPAVEASALLRPFTLEVLRRALADWAPVAGRHPGAHVAVNVAPALLADLRFVDEIAEVLVAAAADPAWLRVEVTERGLTGDMAGLRAGLEQLAGLGVTAAIDDFGTGVSSLAFLRRLPVAEVKVDRVFVRHVGRDAPNRAVVAGCVGIARAVGVTVCAEGVETPEEAGVLADLGCDTIQGYLIGRPGPLGGLDALTR